MEKYSFRLTGLIDFFREKGLNKEECGRFYMFGGECNYLMRLSEGYELEVSFESDERAKG